MNMREILASTGAGITLVDEQIITVSGNWTKAAGVKPTDKVLVWMWGAGGGGARSSQNCIAGGQGGMFVLLDFFAFELPTSVPCVVGTGGMGTANDNTLGGNGGSTFFGSYFANGGIGGRVSSSWLDAGTSVEMEADASHLSQTVNLRNNTSSVVIAPKTLVEFEKPSPIASSGASANVLKAGANGGNAFYISGTGVYITIAGNSSLLGGAGGIGRGQSPSQGVSGDGQIPGGGGGANVNSSYSGSAFRSGNGARGEIRVRVLRGAS